MERRGPAHSAPYGQACMNCFRAKSKCVSRVDGDGCERCNRLRKQCHPSDSLRRRTTQKNQNSTARIAQLEEKLDGLLSLLESVTRSPASSAALRDALMREGDASHDKVQDQHASADLQITTPISTSSTVSTTPTATDLDEGTVPTSTTSVTKPSSLLCMLSGQSSSTSDPSPCDTSAEEAEVSLFIFRSRMLPYFAFVHIPPDVTAQQLQQERPFLFRAIVTVTSTLAQQKLIRGTEFKRVLGQTMLVENQSNLDLLLGLLTYVAWSFDQFLNRSGTLSRLMMLAMSLVYDLRLNKPVPPDVHMIGHYTTEFQNCHGDATDDPEQRFLERQRAILGCFLLSSIVSSYFAQIDPMRWTPRMEECLRAVSANTQCPGDEALAFQVRLQLLAQKAAQIREQEEIESAHPGAAPLPAFLYLKTLRGQLQELRETFPQGLQQEEVLIAHLHYIELTINEAVHTANSDGPLLPAPTAGGSIRPGFERIECLWASVNAIKSYLDSFFTLSPSAYTGISFLFWAQLVRCFVVLYRLSTYEDPSWDREAVRNTVDLLLALDRMTENLELASSEAGEQANDGLLMRLSMLTRMFRARARDKIAPDEAKQHPDWAYSDERMVDQNEMLMMMQSMEFGDNQWLEEVFGRP